MTSRTALWALAALVASTPALAQTYPSRTVRVIVPSPPGGGSDILGRLVSQQLTAALGQPVVVENRVGADGIIGTEHVARSAPDGHTLLVGNATVQVANLFLHKSLPYQPIKDFVPITGGVESVTCIAVNAALPIHTVADLVDYAKKNPGKFTYGSSGAGGAYHISGESFKAVTGTDLVHVPYKGLAPAMTAVMSGQISGAITSVTVVTPQVRAGKARIVAIIENKRYSKLPDVPTVRETIPEFRGSTIWNGFFAPAGTPAPIVSRLNAEMVKAVSSPEVLSKLDSAEVIGGTPEQFAAYVNTQVEVFGRIVKLTGIAPK
jgi:tripartite-type tricarboxylate transporter receptor subunit TctC